MRCSLDKVLLDARQLANRIRATDETADILIKQASDAHSKIIAKKQCQEEIMSFDELNQIVKGRPRSRFMMCIAAENKQLELLRQENQVLRTSLCEYETTFEMIMHKFRKHKNILTKLDQLEGGDFKDSNISLHCDPSSGNRIIILCSKVTTLKRAIEKALIIDNKVTDNLMEIETKLCLENTELRRLVEISREFQNSLPNDLSMASCTQAQTEWPITSKAMHPSVSVNEPHPPINGCAKEKHNIVSTVTKFVSKFPLRIANANEAIIKTKSDWVNDRCATTFSDDDDDRSSVASDASVKTLI